MGNSSVKSPKKGELFGICLEKLQIPRCSMMFFYVFSHPIRIGDIPFATKLGPSTIRYPQSRTLDRIDWIDIIDAVHCSTKPFDWRVFHIWGLNIFPPFSSRGSSCSPFQLAKSLGHSWGPGHRTTGDVGSVASAKAKLFVAALWDWSRQMVLNWSAPKWKGVKMALKLDDVLKFS